MHIIYQNYSYVFFFYSHLLPWGRYFHIILVLIFFFFHLLLRNGEKTFSRRSLKETWHTPSSMSSTSRKSKQVSKSSSHYGHINLPKNFSGTLVLGAQGSLWICFKFLKWQCSISNSEVDLDKRHAYYMYTRLFLNSFTISLFSFLPFLSSSLSPPPLPYPDPS